MANEIWYTGKVCHGLHNGTGFGFPTANVQLYEPAQLETGIYAVWVKLDGIIHQGMLYIGTRPTLGFKELMFEINIFDFEEEIYDHEIAFCIVARTRSEQKFSSIDELIRQLERDRETSRKILDEMSE